MNNAPTSRSLSLSLSLSQSLSLFIANSSTQVHYAELNDGTPVAVKIQYPEVEELFRGDLLTLSIIMSYAEWKFPDLQLSFLAPEFERNLRQV